MTSLEHLRLSAILGEYPRGGTMVMLFATELMKPRAATRDR
jgi:hypothetical protein